MDAWQAGSWKTSPMPARHVVRLRRRFATVSLRAYRGDIVGQVVTAALEASERFEMLAGRGERRGQRRLDRDAQLSFAGKALGLRYPEPTMAGMQPAQLLNSRRAEDVSDDLWTVFNRVQENLLGGGLVGRTPTGRLSRTRRITSIRADVRLNSRLWDLAEECAGRVGQVGGRERLRALSAAFIPLLRSRLYVEIGARRAGLKEVPGGTEQS